jgi:hypothetical protein
MGQSDPIETVTFKHEEGNEGEKIGVKRRIAAFYGGKLLKRQGRWTDSGVEIFSGGSSPERPDRSPENCRRSGAGRGTVINSAERHTPHTAPTLARVIPPFRAEFN